jgi:lipoyl(octanoyl) transferase
MAEKDSAPPIPEARIRRLGRKDYLPTWEAMRLFTEGRDAATPDELWLVEHPPVFTLGQAGRPEHLLRDIGVPVVHTDRGGQVTYHGPGQAIVYALVDLRRRHWTVRWMVDALENAAIGVLADAGIAANRRVDAPGVYLGAGGEGGKIASLGLRVRNGRCYHGIAFNVDLDLAPFAAINPCGYPGLAMARTKDLGLSWGVGEAAEKLCAALLCEFRRLDALAAAKNMAGGTNAKAPA